MNDYTIESFINFCDDIEIVQERLSTRLLDKDYIHDGKIKLYHGSPNKLTTIDPTSVNMGNRLERGRSLSSFWTRSFGYAAVWALDHRILEFNLPIIHDIEDEKVIIPDAMSEIGLPFWKLIALHIDDHPVYVYEATIPVTYVSRGQLPINEYTVNYKVNPDKKYTLKWSESKKYIKCLPEDEFFKRYESDRSGTQHAGELSFAEKAIFKSPNTTLGARARNYKLHKGIATMKQKMNPRYRNLVLGTAAESSIN